MTEMSEAEVFQVSKLLRPVYAKEFSFKSSDTLALNITVMWFIIGLCPHIVSFLNRYILAGILLKKKTLSL